VSRLLLSNAFAVALALGGVSLCLLLLHVLERVTSTLVAHHWGWRGVLVTGWLGVPVHELSHLASAKLFGHRIVCWSLFDPDPTSGTLGYVRHAHARRSAWQLLGNFWIGVAPALVGCGALGALLWWMMPAEGLRRIIADTVGLTHHGLPPAATLMRGVMQAVGSLVEAIWRGRSAWLPLQLYVAIAVACHMAPSRADLQASLGGLAILVVLLGGICGIASLLGLAMTAVLAIVPVGVLVLAVAVIFQLLWAGIVTATAR
jgi:hypothetical protein